MNIQLYQLFTVMLWAAMALAFWKIEHTKIRIIIAVSALLLFAFNPIRLEEKNVSVLEEPGGKIFVVPPKTIIDSKSFEDMQKEEMESLKTQSEEKQNEVHN